MAKNIEEEVENKIIDEITSSAGGRLIAYKPEAEKKGVDLVVEKKGKYKDKEAGFSFQISTLLRPAGDYNFIKEFLQDDLLFDKNFFLLFVYFDEVQQKIDQRVWLLPSLEFKGIAKTIRAEDNKRILRFQSYPGAKDEYSKFLIDIKELGKILLFSLESGKKINFDDIYEAKKVVNLDELKEFIVEARENTFAKSQGAADNPRLLNSKQFEFEKGYYFYRDIFFTGEKKFIGQEIVYLNSRPVWGMNYLGSAMEKKDEEFLKEVLLKLSEKCRFGQSCQFEKRELKYEDSGRGALSEFSGKEQILYKGKSIYTLSYHGGLI